MKYFGTDGLRGKVGTPIMDEAFIKRFGIALARYLRIRHGSSEVHVVIGRDTRKSGELFAQLISESLMKYGINVDFLGIIPTAAVSYWVDELEADHGVMLTASHNDASYNGIKLFNAHGLKQTQDKEAMLEALLDEEPQTSEVIPQLSKKPEYMEHEQAIPIYVENICEILPKNSLSGWKIVLDTANGAAYRVGKLVMAHLGAECIFLGDGPNGDNINMRVGSEYPAVMQETVIQEKADLGIALDGDADRMVVCCKRGNLIPGESLLGLFARYAFEKKTLTSPFLVTTVNSNFGLDNALQEFGIKVVRTDVGDRAVYAAMEKHKANIGGESSGHYIFSDYAQCGDGLLAALKLFELMLEWGKGLSELASKVVLFPQKTVALPVEEKVPFAELPEFQKQLDILSERISSQGGRILVRYSGTEPKIRLLAEAKEESLAEATLQELISLVQNTLSVQLER